MITRAPLVGLAGIALLAGATACQNTQSGPSGSAAVIAGEDDEVSLTLDQVPAEVRATILAHTPASAIVEIELDNEGGKSVYDVEVAGGSEFVVAPDGAYLGLEEDDDDGDDDQDDD